jgi:DNA-binding LytR/AlgR family response regulator
MTLRREFSLGFLFWLSVVVVLEPGNVMRAVDQGVSLPLGEEIIRLVGAGLLGAIATPAVFAMTRRYRLVGPYLWRNAAFHLAADAALAVTLIVTSCILASWLLAEEHRPLAVAIAEQLAVDGLLLFACLVALTGVAHWALRHPAEVSTAPPAGNRYLSHVTAKERGVEHLVRLDTVDWIETQGNYLALHAGDNMHLIRETSVRFENQLDPARFVRIHRRTLVAIARVHAVEALAGGDAVAHLVDGTELRVSRNHREALRARLSAIE